MSKGFLLMTYRQLCGAGGGKIARRGLRLIASSDDRRIEVSKREPVCVICGESTDALYEICDRKRVHYSCLVNARVWKRLRALEEREKGRVK